MKYFIRSFFILDLSIHPQKKLNKELPRPQVFSSSRCGPLSLFYRKSSVQPAVTSNTIRLIDSNS
jgi:hypothetical protein